MLRDDKVRRQSGPLPRGGARLGLTAAMRFWARPLLDVSQVTAQDLRRGGAIARKRSDQAFGIADCTFNASIVPASASAAMAQKASPPARPYSQPASGVSRPKGNAVPIAA
jgi:hypothetical protein